jgi:hypothetical protein
MIIYKIWVYNQTHDNSPNNPYPFPYAPTTLLSKISPENRLRILPIAETLPFFPVARATERDGSIDKDCQKKRIASC